ncbi:MAG: hypothetical protein IJ109_01100 [Firmicutes bacterium]|nr:hypothetical protein [Bacillota bacterium]
MNLTYIVFTCLIFVVAGALLAWFVSSDDLDGMWVSIGVMEGEHLALFPPGVPRHTLSFDEGRAAYFIGEEQMPVTRSGRRLQVELAAQIFIEYRLSISEGNLIMTDPRGMRMVFEKIEEDEDLRNHEG